MNKTKSFKNTSNRTIKPEFRHFCDDEIQGQSLSQGQCKDSVGISTSIWLLLLNSVSIGDTVVKKCGGHFFLYWFDWCMALPLIKSDIYICLHIYDYSIIDQYQQFGVVASKPKLRTFIDIRWHLMGINFLHLEY